MKPKVKTSKVIKTKPIKVTIAKSKAKKMPAKKLTAKKMPTKKFSLKKVAPKKVIQKTIALKKDLKKIEKKAKTAISPVKPTLDQHKVTKSVKSSDKPSVKEIDVVKPGKKGKKPQPIAGYKNLFLNFLKKQIMTKMTTLKPWMKSKKDLKRKLIKKVLSYRMNFLMQ
jgi:hypothetical protein